MGGVVERRRLWAVGAAATGSRGDRGGGRQDRRSRGSREVEELDVGLSGPNSQRYLSIYLSSLRFGK